jgi:hypothetical protein
MDVDGKNGDWENYPLISIRIRNEEIKVLSECDRN